MRRLTNFRYILIFIMIGGISLTFSPPNSSDNIKEYWLKTSGDKKWYNPVIISNEIYFDDNPSIAADKYGNIHVVWEVNSRDIYYKYWSSSSRNWSPDINFSAACSGVSLSPSIAADNFGNVHVVWHDYTNYGGSGTDADIFYRRKDNLTGSWGPIEVLTSTSSSNSRYPKITVDRVGNAHMIWSEGNTYYKQWDGVTKLWQGTETAATNDDYPDTDLTVDDQGEVHVASKYDGGPRPYMLYRKRNELGNWVDDFVFDDIFTYNYNPSLATDKNGDVHVMWTAGFGAMSGTYRIRYNSTSTWSDYMFGITSKRTYDNVLRSDPIGNIYLIGRIETVQDTLDFNIFIKILNATTSTWTDPITINEGSSFNSYCPTFTVDNNDNIHVVYIENSNVYYCRYYTSNPEISIDFPNNNQKFGRDAPNYHLSINGSYSSIWYTLDGALTNITANSLTGTINQTAWNALSDGTVIIDFYANNSAGIEGTAQVQVIKDSLLGRFEISGYNIYVLVVSVGITTVFIIRGKKRNK